MEKLPTKPIIGISIAMLIITLSYQFLIPEPDAKTQSKPLLDPQPSGKVDDGGSLLTEVEPDNTDSEVYCLAINIYHESRGDSLVGRAAVADVVMNRVEEDNYPDTVCGVVQQAVYVKNWKGNIVPKRHQCQFSWYCDGMSDDPTDITSWDDSYNLAKKVYEENFWRGVTEGSTHYHAAHMRANWARDRGMEYKGTIGQHEFYKWNR